MRSMFLVVFVLASASAADAQSVRTQIHKGATFGVDAGGAALWAYELDGNPRTREALIVRVNEKIDRLEYLPVGVCPDGQVRRGQWVEPFSVGASHLADEWMVAGWIARAGDRDVFTVQGIWRYVEVTFDLPPCGAQGVSK